MDLFNWHLAVSTGQVKAKRTTVTIYVLDEAGNPKTRFIVSEAWPIRYDPSD
jgi:phage tail-like protein